MKPLHSWLMLAAFLLASFAAATLGGLVTGAAVRDWYPTIAKPDWTPPSWIFGPVWTALYTMMAVAGWLVWRRAGWSSALIWFAVQLALNATWSPVFFGLHRIGWALVNIILLWLAIGGTMVAFRRITPVAGWLFLPYLAWVSFATALNFAIWRRTPHEIHGAADRHDRVTYAAATYTAALQRHGSPLAQRLTSATALPPSPAS